MKIAKAKSFDLKSNDRYFICQLNDDRFKVDTMLSYKYVAFPISTPIPLISAILSSMKRDLRVRVFLGDPITGKMDVAHTFLHFNGHVNSKRSRSIIEGFFKLSNRSVTVVDNDGIEIECNFVGLANRKDSYNLKIFHVENIVLIEPSNRSKGTVLWQHSSCHNKDYQCYNYLSDKNVGPELTEEYIKLVNFDEVNLCKISLEG